jgi:hypothetical protein
MTYDRKAPRPQHRKYPDPVDNKLFTDCMRARAQATYFGLEWTITEDEYIQMWRHKDLYKEKGRANHQYCLVRKDYEKGWHLDNVHIITRGDHYQICSREKIGKFAERKKKRESKKNV